jgi:hypothetical protein
MRERVDADDPLTGFEILREIEDAEDLQPEENTRVHSQDLRGEAEELKQCFTRYAFYSIGFCSMAIAGIIQFMIKEPIVGLSALGLLPVIFAVCRLGTYKYTNSNRAYGYELYMERSRDVPKEFCGRWKPVYRRLSWEEAMHAWRVVQPSLFEAIYDKPLIGPDRIKSRLKIRRNFPAWFLASAEVGAAAQAKWSPGTYLTNLLIFLYLIGCAAVLVFGWAAVEFWRLPAPLHGGNTPWFSDKVNGFTFSYGFLVCALMFGATAAVTAMRWRNDSARCRNVRVELLSIPACAQVWQAVVVAHYSALARARQYRLSTQQLTEIVRALRGKEKKDAMSGNAELYVKRAQTQRSFDFVPDGIGMTGYAFWLGQQAASLAASPLDISGWIAGPQSASTTPSAPQPKPARGLRRGGGTLASPV